MRFLGIIPVLLLAATTTVFAQAFSLKAGNEPLNKVLRRLGLEISFDDKALSGYVVSASKTFENPEKALLWLLEDKPFRVEKIGKVYVIVPDVNPQRDEPPAATRETRKKRFFMQGTVVSQSTGEPLEYTAVSLLDDNNQLITTGITNSNGQFAIQSARIPAKIKISYLGYETLLRELPLAEGETDVFSLKEEGIELNEIVVSPDNHRQGINRSVFTVTPQMREGAENALELLNKIPGAYYDKSSHTVRLNHFTNILFLVDGIQHSCSYLNHLSPDRIQAIEVVYDLSGRFVSDDYAGIIHFILKKDYTGYDIHVLNVSSFNLSKTAAGSRLSESRPSLGFIVTTRKLNFFGMYEYGLENRNMQSSKSLVYGATELVSMPSARPNNLYDNENHTVTGGVNVHITPLQLFGVQADYSSGKTYTLQEYTMRRSDLSGNADRIFANATENRIDARAFTSSVFYQGQVSDRLHLYGDFSYNYYYNIIENEYRQDETSYYRYNDMWDEYKNQTVLNVEAKYRLSDWMTAETGYSNIRRQYASQSSQGRGFLDYGEHRNKAFAYLTFSLSDKAGLKSGIAFEHIRQRNITNETDYLRVLPYLQIDCKINRSATIAAGYAAGQSYPALYQLSPISSVIDTFLTQIGNPLLKSAVRHQFFTELTLWKNLKLTPQFHYISDGISEIYEMAEYKLYRTFENISFREYSLLASCDRMLGRYFRLKNSVKLYRSEALHSDIRSALTGWTFHSEADYYHSKSSFGAQVAYYRNMKMNMLWQGYQMSDKDYWCVSARKELYNNRLSVMLSYIPPIPFGVRYDRTKEMDTSLYKEKSVMNLSSYNQMLLLKISFRFNRGSIKPAESRTIRNAEEREK